MLLTQFSVTRDIRVGVREWLLGDTPLHQVKYELSKTVGAREVGVMGVFEWEFGALGVLDLELGVGVPLYKVKQGKEVKRFLTYFF